MCSIFSWRSESGDGAKGNKRKRNRIYYERELLKKKKKKPLERKKRELQEYTQKRKTVVARNFYTFKVSKSPPESSGYLGKEETRMQNRKDRKWKQSLRGVMVGASQVTPRQRIHLPMKEMWVQSLGWEDPSHSGILAWKIPWTEKPGGCTVHGISKSGTQLPTKQQ